MDMSFHVQWHFRLVSCGKFRSPYLGKATYASRKSSATQSFQCVQCSSVYQLLLWWNGEYLLVLLRQPGKLPLLFFDFQFQMPGDLLHAQLETQMFNMLYVGWRGGSIGIASDSRFKDWRFEPRPHREKKIVKVFPSQKCCADSLSVCPTPMCF